MNPVSQRCIDLLGRTIDLNFIIKHIGLIFYDIELAFTKQIRWESLAYLNLQQS